MCITSCLCVCRTAAFLMKHLAYMSMHDAKTGMNSKNLAIVWAPNLLKYFCPRLLHNVFSCDKTIRMLFCWQVLKKLHAFALCQLFWLLQFCCSCINGVMMDAFWAACLFNAQIKGWYTVVSACIYVLHGMRPGLATDDNNFVNVIYRYCMFLIAASATAGGGSAVVTARCLPGDE